ncbi:MAG TPA: bifunctional diguanylate cyclase/phosphodiesterase [Verrucomicrobiae bacterium]|nr:bifunctional diguanylate cyclase/phosphodiesterase [Verrucomicrobiae bacterium]
MDRRPATVRAWASWSGIVVTVLSALVLAVVMVKVSQLDELGGLDPATLASSQVALFASSDLLDLQEVLTAYRRAVALSEPPLEIAALRDDIDARLSRLDTLYDGGAAAALDPLHDWKTLRRDWQTARVAPPGDRGIRSTSRVLLDIASLVSDNINNSNLNYDSDPAGQNLADLAVTSPPNMYESVSRSQVESELSVLQGGMPLLRRLGLAGALSNIRAGLDLDFDKVPEIVDTLKTLLPERNADSESLLALTGRYTKTSAAYERLISANVLLAARPTLDPRVIDARARVALDASHALRVQAAALLASMLQRRGQIFEQRKRLIYVATLVGALLLVGLMLIIAQFVARRDSDALRRAKEESERLGTELARQKAEEALRLSEAQFRAVFEGAAIGIAVLDRNGNLLDANGVFRSLFLDGIAAALEGHERELGELLAGERDTFEYEQHLRTPSGIEIWTDATVSVVNAEDGPLFAVCMFRDKTALKHSERRMLHDKTHDALTGLPNRQLFEEHLRRRFEEATALLDSFFAVVFVDLEHFRDVNESLGHAAGDSVLTQVAQRLRSSVDARDVVARLGSDEFAVLLQSLGDILHVESVARRILNNLSKMITVGGRSIYLGASVGIAIGSASYERAEDVTRDAEIAMQHAKSGGGARYALFDSKMQDRAQKRLQLTSDIRLALERNEFRLLYQPIVNIVDGTPFGCEALLRWDHPSEGVMSPTEFMPIAEQSGLAIPIGRFVIQTACEQLSAWRRNRNGQMDFNMHVNVSAAELVDPDFERHLVSAIEHHGLAPEDLIIEITESVVLDSGTRANVTLERIRDRGFSLCIDDFGTGYSSLRYLQQFKVDAIKIDRGFVSGSDGELASEPIVRTLMTLAEAFDVRVVAEGVETVRQREILRGAGCRLAQGYLYSRPISAAEMVSLYPDVLGRLAKSASA